MTTEQTMTVQQVLASNMLDHPSATFPGMVEFGSDVPDDVTDVYAMVDRILADDRLHVALSSPPADDVQCDYSPREDMRCIQPAGHGGQGHMVSDLATAEAARARITPPADDVREALAAVLDDSLLCWTYNGTHTVFHPTKGADAVLARFEVRPHGTVKAGWEDYDTQQCRSDRRTFDFYERHMIERDAPLF